MRHEILISVKIKIFAFRIMTPYNLVGGYKYFAGTYCLDLFSSILYFFLLWRWKQNVSPEREWSGMKLHSVINQQIKILWTKNALPFLRSHWMQRKTDFQLLIRHAPCILSHNWTLLFAYQIFISWKSWFQINGCANLLPSYILVWLQCTVTVCFPSCVTKRKWI